MDNNKKICPFRDKECTPDCMLYVTPDELNETVNSRLRSIGVVSGNGDCALKNIALSSMRKIFETTGVKRF